VKVQVTFSGGEAIVKALAQLAEDGRKASLEALTAGAEPIAESARRLCRRSSVGPHLADHIGITAVRKSAQATEETSVAIGVPNKFFYDYFLEYGTGHAAAYPFYRPALDSEAPNALNTIRGRYWVVFAKRGLSARGGGTGGGGLT
jgi:HK97 gp10 family phage protein